MSYDPRTYWRERYQREGALTVSTRESRAIFEKQERVFGDAILRLGQRACRDHPYGHTLTALDFGCGVGRFTDRLINLGYRVDGWDIAPEAIGYARERHRNEANLCTWGAGSLFGRPWYTDRGPYSLLLAITVVQHITDDAEVIRLGRCIPWADDGKAIIIDDATQGPTADHVKVRKPHEVGRLLGLRVLEIRALDAEHRGSHWVASYAY